MSANFSAIPTPFDESGHPLDTVPDDSASLEPNPQEAIAFVSRMFRPGPDGDFGSHLLLWTHDLATKYKQSNWFRTLPEFQVYVETQAAPLAQLEVYIGMGLSAPDARKGSAPGELGLRNRLGNETVGSISALWADLDTTDGHTGHNGKQYAPDLDTLLDKVGTFPLPPSELVHSGHGLQSYWFLDEPLDVAADRQAVMDRLLKWQELLRTRMAPYDIDSVADLSRILRLPGFLNNKGGGNPKRVRSLMSGGPTHTVESIDALLPAGTPVKVRPQARTNGAAPSLDIPHDPRAYPDPVLFAVAMENDARFALAWDGHLTDIKDMSPSGQDMSIANAAAFLEWTEEEIVKLLIARRRHVGASDKHLSYFPRTARKALEFARSVWDGEAEAREETANQEETAAEEEKSLDAKNSDGKNSDGKKAAWQEGRRQEGRRQEAHCPGKGRRHRRHRSRGAGIRGHGSGTRFHHLLAGRVPRVARRRVVRPVRRGDEAEATERHRRGPGGDRRDVRVLDDALLPGLTGNRDSSALR